MTNPVPDLTVEVVAHCPNDRAECTVDADGWTCPECGQTWDLEGRHGEKASVDDPPLGDLVHATRIPLPAPAGWGPA